jgi:hypothetical protein
MTISLELTPTEEAMLTNAAEMQGIPIAQLAKQLVIISLPAFATMSANAANPPSSNVRHQDRIAAIDSVVGKYAHLPGVGAEELHRERQKDKERDERLATFGRNSRHNGS